MGLGSLLSAYCFGPLCSLGLINAMGSWDLVLFAQLAYLGGIAVGCLALRSLLRRQGFLLTPVQGAVSYGLVTLLCVAGMIALGYPLLGSGAAASLLFVVGVATAAPLLFWYQGLLDVCRAQGRARCIVCIAAAQLLPVIAIVLASVIQPAIPEVGLVGMVVAAVVAALCQVAYGRGRGPVESGVSARAAQDVYRLTPFSVALLACLGVTWGLGCSVSTYTMESGLAGIPAWVLPLTGVAACVIIAGMSSARDEGGIRFGGLIRLAVVAAGMVLAFVAALHDTLPILFYPLCEIIIVCNEVAVMLFSIEVCYERGLRLANVMPVNYGLFAGCACLGSLLFWALQTLVGGTLAWELVAACSTVAVVLIIPFLPSRTSDAVTFTLDELPENEGYEERAAKKRANLADKFGLSEREREVLEPLMRGLTRQQIAEELGLSPWTIKDRVASIYEKVDVHSYKELMQKLE